MKEILKSQDSQWRNTECKEETNGKVRTETHNNSIKKRRMEVPDKRTTDCDRRTEVIRSEWRKKQCLPQQAWGRACGLATREQTFVLVGASPHERWESAGRLVLKGKKMGEHFPNLGRRPSLLQSGSLVKPYNVKSEYLHHDPSTQLLES